MIEALSLAGEPLPRHDAAVSRPSAFAAPRRAGSIRRSTALDATWPDGPHGPIAVWGRGHDLVTPAAGREIAVLDETQLRLTFARRIITAIDAMPQRPSLTRFVGAGAGGQLRRLLAEVAQEQRFTGSPFYLLLDDFPGLSLVCHWAQTRWAGGDPSAPEGAPPQEKRDRVSVCIGYRVGSAALIAEASGEPPNSTAIVERIGARDPVDWPLPTAPDGAHFRRARRIDVWREHGLVSIDAAFQDSAAEPGGGRRAIHEYSLSARADAAGILLSVDATPTSLPYAECAAATVNIAALVGIPIAELRTTVPRVLRRAAGCTHLNDALRALADVPEMLSALQRIDPA